jgi:hypothetical protein
MIPALLPRLIALASRLRRQGRPRVEVLVEFTGPDGLHIVETY